MEEIFPKQPFTERLEFVGSITQGEKIAEGLHFVLQFTKIKEGLITGCILGTQATFREISKVSALPGPTLQMCSQERTPMDMKVTSDKVYWERVTNISSHSPEMLFKVADLDFHNITIKRPLSQDDIKERHLTFFLCGPKTMWTVFEMREQSFTGDETIEVLDTHITLDESLPFEIEIVPHYFYDQTPPPDGYQLKTKVLALHFRTTKTVAELTDEEFTTQAISITEDLTLLVSFISRRWVTWYSYEFQSNKMLLTYVRQARECPSDSIGHYRSVIPLHQAREFLKLAFTNLRKLRASSLDLEMPIVYFVSGLEAKYLEEQFTVLFLGLERIKDLFAINKAMLENLPRSEFGRLKSNLSGIIQSAIQTSEIANRVQGKLPELNRPSLRTVLEALFSEYKVEWRDLYPPENGFTLIGTRDSLFHSSKETNFDLFNKELHRLQALLERTMLAMLGWSDIRNSPAEDERKWLILDK